MNSNCLEGMKCPKCGSFEPFRILVTAAATVYDNGTDDFENVDWDDGAWCQCMICDYTASVKDFKVKGG